MFALSNYHHLSSSLIYFIFFFCHIFSFNPPFLLFCNFLKIFSFFILSILFLLLSVVFFMFSNFFLFLSIIFLLIISNCYLVFKDRGQGYKKMVKNGWNIELTNLNNHLPKSLEKNIKSKPSYKKESQIYYVGFFRFLVIFFKKP